MKICLGAMAQTPLRTPQLKTGRTKPGGEGRRLKPAQGPKGRRKPSPLPKQPLLRQFCSKSQNLSRSASGEIGPCARNNKLLSENLEVEKLSSLGATRADGSEKRCARNSFWAFGVIHGHAFARELWLSIRLMFHTKHQTVWRQVATNRLRASKPA